MVRRFFHHIKEGFYGFSRHLGMSLSSASAVTITLIIISMFILLTSNLYVMTKSIEESLSIVVTVEDSVEENKDTYINNIKEVEGVLEVEYRTKEEEFDYYLESSTGDDSLKDFYESYREDNPFHAAFIITVEDGTKINEIKTFVNNMDGVVETYDGGSNTYLLVNVLDNIRIIGGIVVLALSVLAVYLIYNTIKITISSRSDEIWIMRNVGAKNGYIRAPFLVEGIIIGFIGSLLPIALTMFGYYYLYQISNGALFGAFSLLSPYPFILYVSGLLVALGIVVGFFGSYISVFKYLRVKR